MALALYLAAIYGIHWSASRRIRDAEGRAILTYDASKFPSAHEILVRHSVGWLIGFFVFFLLLGITDFTIWQRLGIGAALALVNGSVWFNQSERMLTSPGRGDQSWATDAWYWLLAVLDWLGFMWTLCFAGALVAELF